MHGLPCIFNDLQAYIVGRLTEASAAPISERSQVCISQVSRILHWITLLPVTPYALLTNSTLTRRPLLASSGRFSYRTYPLSCSSRKAAFDASMCRNGPMSQSVLPINSSRG